MEQVETEKKIKMLKFNIKFEKSWQDTQTAIGKEEEKGGGGNWHLPFFLYSFDIVHVFHSGASPNYEKKMFKNKTKKTNQTKCPAHFTSFVAETLFIVLVLIVHLTRNLNLLPHQDSRWFFVFLQFLI